MEHKLYCMKLGQTLGRNERWHKTKQICLSLFQFDGRRSSEELKKFWQNWEHPSINKNEWTEEETERLKDIAAKHSYLDWQTVAQELGVSSSEVRNVSWKVR